MTAPVIDPFGAAPAAPEPAPVAAPEAPPSDPWASPVTNVKPTVVEGADGKVVLTFKGGTGFDAPWVVIHAASLDDALSYVTEGGAKLADLFTRVQRAATAFNGGSAAPSSSPRQAAPQAAQGPPAGAPAAPGPDWVYKNGITKSGKNQGKMWHGWMPPRGSSESPVFFDV